MEPVIRTLCPLCESKKIEKEFKLNGYLYYRCSSCKCLFVGNKVLTNVLVNSYTKNYFEAYESGDSDQRGYPSYMEAQSTLEKSFRKKLELVQHFVPNGYILDAGAAYGTFLRMLKTSSSTYTGVGLDISQYAAKVALNQFEVPVSSGIIESAPFPDQIFDAVVMWDMIEHLVEPIHALKEVSRILKPGGFIFISTDDVNNWLVRLAGQKWWQLAAPLHLCHISKMGLVEAFQRAGSFTVLGFYKDLRRITLAEVIDNFGVAYKSTVLTNMGTRLKGTRIGSFGIDISRPEQFIFVARKSDPA